MTYMALFTNNLISHNRTLIPLPCPSFFKSLKCPTRYILHPPFLSPQRHPINSQPPLLTISAASFSVNAVPDALESQQQNNAFAPHVTTAGWSEFSTKVSGEWDGHGADFTSEGTPIELPESVVPEAYREWEVKVFDWQTQCPTFAKPEDFWVTYKLIKLLPTVGCEADAATQYSIEERNIGGVDNKVSAFAYQSSGCYVAVWPMQDHATYRLLELEHCLIDPRDRESRVRLIQVVRVEKTKLILQSIKVFREHWYGPFRNGEQLGGCAIRDSVFASTDALKSSELTGVWQGLNAIASFQDSQTLGILQELLDENVRNSVRDGQNLILLPKQLWCSLNEMEDGGTCCEVGWLLDKGHAITSKCIFHGNIKLKEIIVACETADLAQ